MDASSCAAASICNILNIKSRSHIHGSFLRVDRTGDPRFRDHFRTAAAAIKRANEKESKKHRNLVIRNATPEIAAAAGDVVSSSLSIPGIPFSIPTDNPLIAAVAGLFIGVPFVIQRLLALSKQVDMAAETMEKIADTVGKVAEEVDKVAEEIGESLPEGGLKKMVELVEDMAEETVKDAQVVEDLMDKVGELDDKLEALINKQSKGADKA